MSEAPNQSDFDNVLTEPQDNIMPTVSNVATNLNSLTLHHNNNIISAASSPIPLAPIHNFQTLNASTALPNNLNNTVAPLTRSNANPNYLFEYARNQGLQLNQNGTQSQRVG